MKRAVAAVSVVTLLVGTQADAAAASAPEAATQKAALVRRLLHDSLLAKRIATSGSADARRLLAQAAEFSVLADKLISAGETGRADSTLNEAIGLLNRAGQISPDVSHLNHEQWVRHGKLLASVESLHAAIIKHLEGERAAGGDEHWAKELERLMQRARTLAAADQVKEANLVLVQAEAALLAAFKRAYRGNTLDYSPRFRDPQEEFQFELARHRGYLQLVPLAVTELNPPLPAVQAIDGHMSRSLGARERAERFAAQRSFDAALSTLREATGELQRALTAAGVNVPRETKP